MVVRATVRPLRLAAGNTQHADYQPLKLYSFLTWIRRSRAGKKEWCHNIVCLQDQQGETSSPR